MRWLVGYNCSCDRESQAWERAYWLSMTRRSGTSPSTSGRRPGCREATRNSSSGPISWDDVLVRWKRRGPANEYLVGQLQRGYKQLHASAAA